MLKIAPASPEEHAFASEVNARLKVSGARVTPHEIVNTQTQAKTYHLVLQCGSKRTGLTADSPFHYDAVEDVVKRVHQWLAGAKLADRWTTDLGAADRSM